MLTQGGARLASKPRPWVVLCSPPLPFPPLNPMAKHRQVKGLAPFTQQPRHGHSAAQRRPGPSRALSPEPGASQGCPPGVGFPQLWLGQGPGVPAGSWWQCRIPDPHRRGEMFPCFHPDCDLGSGVVLAARAGTAPQGSRFATVAGSPPGTPEPPLALSGSGPQMQWGQTHGGAAAVGAYLRWMRRCHLRTKDSEKLLPQSLHL